jgi:hypothetical protein
LGGFRREKNPRTYRSDMRLSLLDGREWYLNTDSSSDAREVALPTGLLVSSSLDWEIFWRFWGRKHLMAFGWHFDGGGIKICPKYAGQILPPWAQIRHNYLDHQHHKLSQTFIGDQELQLEVTDMDARRNRPTISLVVTGQNGFIK